MVVISVIVMVVIRKINLLELIDFKVKVKIIIVVDLIILQAILRNDNNLLMTPSK